MDRDEPNLGRKIAEYKSKLRYFIIPLLLGAVALVLGLFVAIRAFFLQPQGEMIFVLPAILFFYLGGVLLWFSFRRFKTLRTSYLLYEQGVQCLDRGQEKSIAWSQIATVRREAKTARPAAESAGRAAGRNRRHTLALCDEDGRCLTISDQPRLAAVIVGMLLVHDWPTVYRRIESGEKVPLSRVFVSTEGLEYKGRLVPWSRIHKVNTKDHLILDTTAGRINWPEINDHDPDDVLGFLMLRRVIEHYVHRQ